MGVARYAVLATLLQVAVTLWMPPASARSEAINGGPVRQNSSHAMEMSLEAVSVTQDPWQQDPWQKHSTIPTNKAHAKARPGKVAPVFHAVKYDDSELQQFPKVLLTHLGHEGSHAICQGFMQFCIKADCSEDHDAYHHNGHVPWKAVSELGGVTLLNTEKVNLMAGYNPVVVVLFRSNLLEYSLSNYFKWRAGRSGVDNLGRSELDPQFTDAYEHNAVEIDPEPYDVPDVHLNAQKILELWQTRILFMDGLLDQGSPYRIVEYEQFEAAPEAYMARVAKAVGFSIASKDCELQAGPTGMVSGGFVHDVHPGNWSNYVSNYRHIKQSFDVANYPSLFDLLGKHVAAMV